MLPAGPLLAGLASWLLVALAMPATVDWLRRHQLVQVVRREGPASHLAKQGTPMAAGLIFVCASCLAAWAVRPTDGTLAVAVLVTLGHAALGFGDDYLKVVRRRPEGLLARYKLVGQLVLAGALVVFALLRRPEALLPGIPLTTAHWVLGPALFAALSIVALLGATNGTNFTDGADGLLTTTGGTALLALGILLWLDGSRGLAGLCLALVGGLAGFAPWNWHPARVFMGDTGSMAIGAAFAATGILGGWTLYLPVLGLLFVLEVLSVVAQVVWYRRTGRRLLRMAPLHHHLELSGWREQLLVKRLWIFAALCGAVGLAAHWLVL